MFKSSSLTWPRSKFDPDTQLGAFKAEIDERLDPRLFGKGARHDLLHLAETGMQLLGLREFNGEKGASSPPEPFKPYDSLKCYVEHPEVYGAICGDVQVFASQLFMAFGIKSRPVSMYDNVNIFKFPLNGHASTEVKVKGKWSAIDLTFGFYFKNWLSWKDARKKMLRGEQVKMLKIGEGRLDLEEYYIPLSEIVRYLSVLNIDAEFGGECLSPYKEKPWDGMVRTEYKYPPMDTLKMMRARENAIRKGAVIRIQAELSPIPACGDMDTYLSQKFKRKRFGQVRKYR